MNRKKSRVMKKRTARSPKTPASLLAFFVGVKNETTSRTRTPSRRTRRFASKAPEVITLDETPESTAILNNVKEKVGNFMKTGCFISSDEEDEEPQIVKKEHSVPVYTLDDSEDELIVTPNKVDLDECQPSTSAGTSKINHIDAIDDVLEFVHSEIEMKTDSKEDPLKDLKSLEDYRKETEEMLKSAAILLDEFKTGRKEPEPKEVKSPTSSVTCAICLESLSQRPAASTVCGHLFCKECITQAVKSLKKCPTCRKPLNTKKVHPIYF